MRSVNVPLLITLLVLGAVVAGGGYALHRYQMKRNAGVFLQQAEKARERLEQGAATEEQYKSMVEDVLRQYNSYLALRPDDTAALEAMGDFLMAQRQWPAAADTFERLLRYDADRDDIRRRLVQVSIDMGARQRMHPDPTERARRSARWFGTARQHLIDYLLKSRPNDAELLEWAGRCEESLGNDDQAAEYWRRAIAADPQYVDAYTRLAGLLRKNPRETKQADELIAKLARENPDLHLAQVAAANYSLLTGQVDEAIARVARALELEPQDRDTLILAVRCALAKQAQLLAQRKRDEADEFLAKARTYSRQLRDLFPNDIATYQTAAEVEYRAGNPKGAAEVLREGMQATRDNPNLLFTAVNLLLDSGERAEAHELFEKSGRRALNETLVHYLNGRLKLADEQWREAIRYFELARPTLAAEPELIKQLDYFSGRAWAQLGNYDQAIRSYRLALDRDPFFAPAQTALMESYVNSGQLEAAAELYRQLAGRMSAAGLVSAARVLIVRNRQLRPANRDWTTIERMLDEADRREPNTVAVALARAELYAAQGRTADAERVLAAARAALPESGDIWSHSINLAQQQRDWPKVEALLAEAAEKAGDRVELRLTKARYLTQRYGKEAAPRIRELAQNVDGFNVADQQTLLAGLSALLQGDDLNLAREMVRQLALQQPNNLQVQFHLFELAIRANDSEEMKRAAAEIERIEGQGASWHYAQAVLASVQSKGRDDPLLKKAIEHCRAAIEARPSWGRAYLLLAGIYDQQGDYRNAFDYYREAVDRGERNVAAIRRLADLYSARRDFANAQKTIALVEAAGGGSDLETLRRMSRFDAFEGDLDRALQAARRATENSTNFRDYLWLGQLLESNGRQAAAAGNADEAVKLRDEAEAALLKAAEIAPAAPDVWATMVRFYVVTGQREKAERTVAQIRGKIKPSELPLTLAQCYEALGRGPEAQQQYQEALAAAPQDVGVLRAVADFHWRTQQAAKAKELAQRVLDGQVTAVEADKAWARRLMAVLLVSEGGTANLQKALEMVEQNLKADANSITDLRLKGSLLAILPSRPETEESIAAFRKVVADSALPDDQFILAQLYAKQGNWTACSAQMLNLLAAHGSDPRYLGFYVGQLLKRGEWVNAADYLNRLERAAPNHFETVQYRADYQIWRKDYDGAAQTLKSWIDRDGAIPNDRPTRLRLVAEALERFSHRIREPGLRSVADAYTRDAEMLFRLYIEARPEREIVMVGFLARLGRIGEALDLLERIWEKQQPDPLASAVLEFARSPVVKQAELERLEKTVDQAIKKFEQPANLMLVMAEIYQKENRIDEAEKLYRLVIQREPHNVVALNNLAVLLALESRHLDEALRLVNTAIEHAGREGQILDSRASVYIALRRPNEALRDLEEAINELPDPIRLFHRAQAYFLTGKRQQAAESLNEAFERGLDADKLQIPERKALEELKKVVDLEAARK